MSLSTNIPIEGLSKAEVLASLYNNATKAYNTQLVKTMSLGEAQAILQINLIINKVWGKQIMVDFRKDNMINTYYYDRIQGLNSGRSAINQIYDKKMLKPSETAMLQMQERPVTVNEQHVSQSEKGFIPNASTPSTYSANFMRRRGMNLIITPNNRPAVDVNKIVNVATMPQRTSTVPRKSQVIISGHKNRQVEEYKRKQRLLEEKKLEEEQSIIFDKVEDIDGDDDGFIEPGTEFDAKEGEEKEPDVGRTFIQKPRKSALNKREQSKIKK